jgi:hypothetical protein
MQQHHFLQGKRISIGILLVVLWWFTSAHAYYVIEWIAIGPNDTKDPFVHNDSVILQWRTVYPEDGGTGIFWAYRRTDPNDPETQVYLGQPTTYGVLEPFECIDHEVDPNETYWYGFQSCDWGGYPETVYIIGTFTQTPLPIWYPVDTEDSTPYYWGLPIKNGNFEDDPTGQNMYPWAVTSGECSIESEEAYHGQYSLRMRRPFRTQHTKAQQIIPVLVPGTTFSIHLFAKAEQQLRHRLRVTVSGGDGPPLDISFGTVPTSWTEYSAQWTAVGTGLARLEIIQQELREPSMLHDDGGFPSDVSQRGDNRDIYVDYVRFEGNMFGSYDRESPLSGNETESTLSGTTEAGMTTLGMVAGYPNPVRPADRSMRLVVDYGQSVRNDRVGIYNLSGRLVRILSPRGMLPHTREYVWPLDDELGDEVDNGVYICRPMSGSSVPMVKIVVAR